MVIRNLYVGDVYLEKSACFEKANFRIRNRV